MMSAPHIAAALMMNPLPALLLVVIFLSVMLMLGSRRHETACQRRHRRYRAAAERVMARLPQLEGEAQRLTYLRKINPYVFEELLLFAFELQGYAIARNASYSGDGGLDGTVFIAGRTYFIQAKRYGKAITPSHIRDFGALLQDARCEGFFIHTGRTGQLSRALLQAHPRVHLISGQKLLALLAGNAEWLSFLSGKTVTKGGIPNVSEGRVS
ncbi:restriction endonuclease [Serratia marcescens]|uniref:Restriction endonuclease n=1 Tax=Serratia marcescens TaxID=615 RepID=A0AAP8PFA0_SERMA|nr:restriction endonuclease [Serratia marcescens]PNO64559.1 restriction endonuclease [Serratia marcescens]